MKNKVQIGSVSLSAICLLLLASPLAAQETGNAAFAQTAPEAVAATSAGADQSLSAAADADTNAPAGSATMDSAAQESDREATSPQEIVLMGQNFELKTGETAKQVVVIGGSAKIHGKVLRDAVVIMGTLEVDGEIGGDTVAVLGSVKLQPGAVASRDAVAVMGNLSVAEGATVGHDAVSVMGKLDLATGAVVKGDRVNVGLPVHFPKLEWLGQWIQECVLKFRPLAPGVGWIWIVAGLFFLLSLFIAAVFPRPVQACVETLNKRPATTFLMGLLTELIAPIVIVILAATGIGLLVVPFVGMALFVAARVGKVAIIEWIAFRIGGRFGSAFQTPVVAFLVGSILVTLLYLVPVLGLLTFMLISVWGLGCAVTATFSGTRREMPDKPSGPAQPTSPSPAPMPATGAIPTGAGQSPGSNFAPPTAASFGVAASPGPQGAPLQASAPPMASTAAAPQVSSPICPTALSFPRASFWERMGAAFLDIVIVGILSAFVGGMPLGLLVALAYFSGLWAWKGTTIGGIVLKLQVVRSDGSPLTFPAALVRALAAALSVVVLFLGFLWIAWDKDKQGWHDKIAGTDVIRLARSVPLVCF